MNVSTKAEKSLALFEPRSIDELRERAQLLVQSGILPSTIRKPETAIAIAMTGRELGIGMMESFRSIYVIQGTPTIRPQTMLKLIKSQKDHEDIIVESELKKCTVTMKRKGETAHTEVFGEEDAKSLGLLGKDNYKRQSKTMYKWRAISACARIVWPDAINGMYTPEEIAPEVVTVQENEEVIVDQSESKPDTPTGITADGGKPISIRDLPEDAIDHFVIPFNCAKWEGRNLRFKGKSLIEIFKMDPTAAGKLPNMIFLKDSMENHPIEEVRDVVRRFLEKNHPGYGEGEPKEPPPSDGFEAVDPKEPKATQRQREAINKILEKQDQFDFDGACAGMNFNPKTLTHAQAQRLIRKLQAQSKVGVGT